MKSGSQMDAYDPGGANGVTDPNLICGSILLFDLIKEGCRWSVTEHASSSDEVIVNADFMKQRS